LYGVWDAMTTPKNVYFYGNNGTPSLQIEPENNAATPSQYVLPPIKPTRFGHEFIAWNTEPDGLGFPVNDGVNVVTYYVYAIWSEKPGRHTVTLHPQNDIDAPYDIIVYTGLPMPVEPMPSPWLGHTFLGYTNAVGELYYGPDMSGLRIWGEDADGDLFGAWLEDGFEIAYYGNGGTPDLEVRPLVNDKYDTPNSNPSNPGFTFEGWYTDPLAGNEIQDGDLYSSHGVDLLYAHWAEDDSASWQWVLVHSITVETGTLGYGEVTMTWVPSEVFVLNPGYIVYYTFDLSTPMNAWDTLDGSDLELVFLDVAGEKYGVIVNANVFLLTDRAFFRIKAVAKP
jgi:uncharacterized repeat protein (TIGR02543 family)